MGGTGAINFLQPGALLLSLVKSPREASEQTKTHGGPLGKRICVRKALICVNPRGAGGSHFVQKHAEDLRNLQLKKYRTVSIHRLRLVHSMCSVQAWSLAFARTLRVHCMWEL